MLIFLGTLTAIAALVNLPAIRTVIPSESLATGCAVAVAVLVLWQGGFIG